MSLRAEIIQVETGRWREGGIGRGTALVWAFREEERMADMAVAKAAGSLDCFLRSRNYFPLPKGILFNFIS